MYKGHVSARNNSSYLHTHIPHLLLHIANIMMKAFALFSFAACVLAASRTSAPSGSIVVAKSGGDYSTISDAVSALDTSTTDTQTIFIEEGTYEEQVYIPELSGELIIYGQTEE